MFISFLYMFRANMCPSSGEINLSMRHFIFVTLCRWLSGMQGGLNSTQRTSHLHRVANTKRRIYTVISSDDGHIFARNMQRKEINILRNTVHQVGFNYRTNQNTRDCIYASFWRWYTSRRTNRPVLQSTKMWHKRTGARLRSALTYRQTGTWCC